MMWFITICFMKISLCSISLTHELLTRESTFAYHYVIVCVKTMYHLRHSGLPNVKDPCTSVPSWMTHQQKPSVLLHCSGWKNPLPSHLGSFTIWLGGNLAIYDRRTSHGPSPMELNALATVKKIQNNQRVIGANYLWKLSHHKSIWKVFLFNKLHSTTLLVERNRS